MICLSIHLQVRLSRYLDIDTVENEGKAGGLVNNRARLCKASPETRTAVHFREKSATPKLENSLDDVYHALCSTISPPSAQPPKYNNVFVGSTSLANFSGKIKHTRITTHD